MKDKTLNPEQMSQLCYRIAFAHSRNICLRTAGEFGNRGISPEAFFNTPASTLAALSGCRPDVFSDERRNEAMEKARRELEFIHNNGIRAVYYTDPDYPRRLLECPDAPAILYTMGGALETKHVVAIVGTRHCTPYGISVIERLVADLHNKISDLLIVSGLAYGADIAAHRAALQAGIPTGGVLAHGLNTIYPPEHRNDAINMVQQGGFILSEYRSCDRTHKGNFLARNRIVAGLADVTIVVESDIRGGAITTAKLAGAYQREVMAVPGRVFDKYSQGCNMLIANEQARIVRNADDIIEACCWTPDTHSEGIQQQLLLELTPRDEAVLHFLIDHPDATINDIAIAMGETIPRMQSALFEMEMADLIVSLPGGRYGVTAPIR